MCSKNLKGCHEKCVNGREKILKENPLTVNKNGINSRHCSFHIYFNFCHFLALNVCAMQDFVFTLALGQITYNQSLQRESL